jgi:hypothetical protein
VQLARTVANNLSQLPVWCCRQLLQRCAEEGVSKGHTTSSHTYIQIVATAWEFSVVLRILSALQELVKDKTYVY